MAWVRQTRNFLCSLLILAFNLYSLPLYAGTLEFDGVPVDITTSDGENLTLVPGTGGYIQIGDKLGSVTHADSNDDLYITGILEVDEDAYFDSVLSVANDKLKIDATGDL